MRSSESWRPGGHRQPGGHSAGLLAGCPSHLHCFPSDLSFDGNDLAMLKSLLAGLSLPSKGSQAGQGLDDEGEGEPGQLGLERKGWWAVDRLYLLSPAPDSAYSTSFSFHR